MSLQNNKLWAAVALPAIAVSSMLGAASNDSCPPVPPTGCYPADPDCNRCCGPDNYAALAPVRPKTCDGDLVFTVAGFYWNVQEDGLEYAVETSVQNSDLNRIIDGQYYTPDCDWDFGFKLGLGYNTTHDGWDFGVEWTRFNTSSHRKVEADTDDNVTLLPIWSNSFGTASADIPAFATDIENRWDVDLNLIDVELGREFWISKYITLRPHIGFRVAFINQNFDLEHRGGTFTTAGQQGQAVTNLVKLDNDFNGVGARAGLESVWNLTCGWAFYGNWASSILYGRFHIEHDEKDRDAVAPFQKLEKLSTKYDFKTARLAYDFEIGMLWSTMFSQCRYAFTAMFGWESHIFLDQNQLWRVVPIDNDSNPNSNNVFQQRRGDVSTQGWTLTFKFEF